MTITSFTGLRLFVKDYKERNKDADIMFFFPDRSIADWDEQSEYIKGRLEGILDVVHSSEVLGSSSYDIFIYNNLVNVFVRFDLNSKEMKERVI